MPSVGTAYVNIRVNTKGFTESLDKAMARLSAKMEADGAKLGKSFENGLKSATPDKVFDDWANSSDRATSRIKNNLQSTGDKMSGTGQRMNVAANGMVENLKTIGVEADSTSKKVGGLSRNSSNASRSLSRFGAGGGGGIRSAGNDVGFLSGKFRELVNEAPNASKMMRALYNQMALLGSVSTVAVGGLVAVGQGLFAVGANAASMAPALAIAANGIMSLGQVGSVIGIAMGGVGDAISEGLKPAVKNVDAASNAATKSAKGAAKATEGIGRAIKSAERTVRDAKDGVKDAYEDVKRAVEGVTEAHEDVKRAAADAARAAGDAARQTLRAEQDLAKAQGASLKAQEDLNKAREKGLEQLEDIAFAAEDAGLAERRATLALQDAYAKLQEVSELPPDNRARIEAQLAYEEAELNMRQAVDAREDADKAQQDAAAKGVEGTDAMTDARKDLAAAQEDETEKTAALADAQREAAETAIDNAERMADAHQKVADAQRGVADAQERVVDAQQNLADAQADLADAHKRMADAQKGVADAAGKLPPVIDTTTAAADRFNEMMKKLGPQQQEFVNSILDMQGGFTEFKNAIAEPLFKGLNDSLDILNDKSRSGRAIQDVLQEGLKGTADELGKTAVKGAELARNESFQTSLTSAMGSNNEAIGIFGDTLLNLATAFVQVADAAGPLFVDFAEWTEKVTSGWGVLDDGKTKSDEAAAHVQTMRDSINKAGDRVREFWGLLTTLWDTLMLVGGAASDAANNFGDFGRKGQENKDKHGYITTITDNLKDFNETINKDDLTAKFGTALENLNSASSAVSNIVDPLMDLGSNKDVGKFFDTIAESDAFDKLGEQAEKSLPFITDIAEDLLDIVETMSQSGSIDTFLEILTKVTDELSRFVGWLKETTPGGDTSLLKIMGYISGAAAAASLLWSATKLIGSPFINIGKGLGGVGKSIGGIAGKLTGLVNDSPTQAAEVEKNWKRPFQNIGITASNTVTSIKNTFSRLGNVFKGVSNKVLGTDFQKTDLRDKKETIKKPTVETDAADKTKAENAGESLSKAYARGIREGMTQVEAAMEAIEAKVKSGFIEIGRTVGPTAVKIGGDIMLGLARGIRTGAVEATTAATAAGGKVARAVGDGAGTHSPSTITLKTGDDIMEGLELGIREGSVEAQAAAKTAGSKVARSVATGANAATSSVVAAGNNIGDGVTTGVAGGIDKGTKGGKIGGALGRMSGTFSGAAKVMGGAMRGLGGAMNFMMGPWGMLIMILLPLLMPLLKKLNDKFHITEKIMDVLKTAIDKVVEVFGWLWDKIQGLFEWIQDHWRLLAAILLGPFGIAVGLITKYWDEIWGAISFVFDWIKDHWKLLLAILTGPIGMAVGLIIKYWDEIKAAVQAAVDFVTGLLGTIWDGITAGWDKIVEFFNGLWSDHIKPILDTVVQNAKDTLLKIWDGITTAWTTIVDWIATIWDTISGKIRELVTKAGEILLKIWDGIKDAWWTLVRWSDRIEAWVGDKVQNLVNKAKAVLLKIWDGITEAWGTIKDWADGLWNSISTKISSFITSVGGGVKDIWKGITDAWDTFKTWLGYLWEGKPYSISSVIDRFITNFSGAFGGIWDGIKSGFETAYESVAKLVNKYLIGGVNSVLDFFGAGGIPEKFYLKEDITFARGGPVVGPGGGTDDRIRARLSNGEYVIPAKQARMLGRPALDVMRKTGRLPAGDGKGVLGTIWGGFKDAAGAVAHGTETAVKWVIEKLTNKLGDNMLAKMVKGAAKWATGAIVDYVKGKEAEQIPVGSGADVVVPDPNNPAGRVWWKGGQFTNLFLAHLQMAEKLAGTAMTIYQGGFSTSVDASGTSHWGDAIDIAVNYAILKALRRVGIAAGDRTGLGNWEPHIHAVPGPKTGYAAGSAIWQYLDYIALGGAKQSYHSRWGLSKLATGGVVSPSSTGTLALLAEAGKSERVTPLDPEGFTPAERAIIETLEAKLAGGSGETIHVHPSEKMDETRLADLVARRVKWQRRRGAGRR